jgi:predicted extracellular nuclease
MRLPYLLIMISALAVPAWAQPQARISDVQGRSHTSPLAGDSVTLTGIVTSVARDSTSGFDLITLQSAPSDEDASAATSEALFVRLDDGPAVSTGDLLRVGGRIKEYNPGGVDTNLRFTTLMASGPGEVLDQRALPRAVVLGKAGRSVPAATIDDDTRGHLARYPGEFDPDHDALDFFESLEGMRVAVPDALAVDSTNRYGELVLLPDGGTASESLSGPALVLSAGDYNPERVMVQRGRWKDGESRVPDVDTGARFDAPFVGVMSYGYGNFKVLLTEPAPAPAGAVEPFASIGAVPEGHARIASYNVENLSPSSAPAKFAVLGRHIAQDLGAPDLVALQEIQDDSGPVDDGVTSGAATLAALVEAIDAAGGPAYEALEIPPEDGADGGQPGGNIRVAFLVRTDGALEAVRRPGGGPKVAVDLTGVAAGAPALSHSPGRLAPDDTAWRGGRVPLVLELAFAGEPLFVVSCHLKSKGGDTPLFGMVQPFERPSEELRGRQAQVLADFVRRLTESDPSARVVVLGDLNDFQFSEPVRTLISEGGLHNLTDELPAGERWTYIYQGNAQALDHVLVSPGFAEAVGGLDRLGYGVAHLNTAFTTGASDHDPCVLTFPVPGRDGTR